jgi:hypothetical protein
LLELTGDTPVPPDQQISPEQQFLGDLLAPVPPVLKMCKVGEPIVKSGDDLVDVFRAVKPDELANIQKTSAFNNLPGLEGKYFTTSAESAADYARKAVSAFDDPPYTIIQSQVPRNVLNQPGISATVDSGIPAYVIPNKDLSGLAPQILNYSPVP